MRSIKVTIAIVFVGILISLLAGRSLAYPPFVAKAKKFGAKDCTFCHVDPEGGPPWNERGQWLIKEKEKRGADSVDVEWLADYKPSADKKDDKATRKEDQKQEKKEEKKEENKEDKKPPKPPVAAGLTEQELFKLERDLIDANVNRDAAAMERILADDFVIIYPDGSLWNKADEIANLKKAVRKGAAPQVSTEDVRVRVYGDTAVLTGVIVHEGTYASGSKTGQEYKTRHRYTDVYVKRAGRWQLASSQLTDIRGAAEAIHEPTPRVGRTILDSYVGEYELPMFVLTITRDADRLFGQPQGDSKRELVALSETDFSVNGDGDTDGGSGSHAVTARIVFVKDTAGRVSGMKVSVNGQQFEGKKIK